MGIGFQNPAFLWALAAAAAPVLVHLVFRRKAVQVDFSSVHFLKLIDVRLARNRRLREILVLALRAAVLALCVLALARPVWKPDSAGSSGEGSTAMVVIVDSSASMRIGRGGRTAFDAGLAAARAALSTLRKGDEAAVIFPGAADPGSPELSRFLDEARAGLDAASCGFGRGLLAPAAAEAASVLGKSFSPNKELVLLTDMRAASLEGAGPHGIAAQGARFFLVPVAFESERNVSVSGAKVVNPPAVAGNPLEFAVTVTNHGASEESGAASFTVDSAKFGEREYSIGPGQSAELMFRHTFEKAGEFRVSIGIPGDSLAADDACFLAVPVSDRIPVLIVNGSPSDQVFLDEVFYVRAALELGGRTPDESQSLFRMETMLDPVLDGADLSAFRAVILANVRRPGPRAAKALAGFVESGGGLVVFPGDMTVPGLYSRVLVGSASGSPLLPAEFASIETAGEEPLRIGKVDFDSGLFEPFRGEANMDFSAAAFRKYMNLKPGAGAEVAAEFSNGSPAAVSAVRGQGRVVQFASTCDLDWNNLPTRAVFLPLLYRTVCYAAGVDRAGPAAAAVGDRDVPSLPEGLNPAEVRVVSPTGSSARLEMRPGSKPSTPPLGEPGFHALEAAQPHKKFAKTLAVNVDPRESGLGRAQAGDFSMAAGLEATVVDDPENLASVIQRHRRGVDLGVYMLICALALAVAEVFAANRSLWRAAPAVSPAEPQEGA